jgi:hypothetical protein
VSIKRVILVGLMLAMIGWVGWIAISMRNAANSIRNIELSNRQSVESPAEVASPSADQVSPFANSQESGAELEPQAGSPNEAQDDVRAATTLETTGQIANDRKVQLPQRCGFLQGTGIFLGDIAAYGVGIYVAYTEMSDTELRALADSGTDGFAQYLYAYQRILDAIAVNPDEDVSESRLMTRLDSPEAELFKSAERYFIGAVQNHNWIAANRLAAMYEPFDKVQARAWLLIEREAGGTTLESREDSGEDDGYTEGERNESAVRAQALIDEFDLGRGLLPPDECLATSQ